MSASTAGNSVYVFMIIGKGDVPLYEVDLSSRTKRDDTPHLHQFVIHQALDVVDDLVWQSNAMYFKNIDSFNNFNVSAFCSAGHIKFMLLHKNKTDSNSTVAANVETGIRMFLFEVHELFLRYMINPLYELNGLITSTVFNNKINFAAKKHLVYS